MTSFVNSSLSSLTISDLSLIYLEAAHFVEKMVKLIWQNIILNGIYLLPVLFSSYFQYRLFKYLTMINSLISISIDSPN